MQTYYNIENRLKYVNEKLHMAQYLAVEKYIVEGCVLRGIDQIGRIIFVKQFNNERELFQFLCGMEHILEAI